jgi:GAF domain-containing protein
LAEENFLALADRTVIQEAIIIAGCGVANADACDLQTYDPRTGVLSIAHQRGFRRSFLDYFTAVDADVPSACGTALATGDPVLIDDVSTSRIFAGHPTRDVVLAAGTRAVQSYPMHNDGGEILGVLSLHYRSAGRHPGQEMLAWSAAQALASLVSTAPAGAAR